MTNYEREVAAIAATSVARKAYHGTASAACPVVARLLVLKRQEGLNRVKARELEQALSALADNAEVEALYQGLLMAKAAQQAVMAAIAAEQAARPKPEPWSGGRAGNTDAYGRDVRLMN